MGKSALEVSSLVGQTILFAPNLSLEYKEEEIVEMVDITGNKLEVFVGEPNFDSQSWKIVDSYSEVITDINSIASGSDIEESFSTQLVDLLVIEGSDFLPEEPIIEVGTIDNALTGIDSTITWTDNFDGEVKIELFKAEELVTIISDRTESDGSYEYDWQYLVDGEERTLEPGTDYRIKISQADEESAYDLSDEYFAIALPEIQVTAPNSEEKLEPGETVEITWTDNLDKDVSINLYHDDIFVETVAAKTESDGSYEWTIPKYTPSWVKEMIKVDSSFNAELNVNLPIEYKKEFNPYETSNFWINWS